MRLSPASTVVVPRLMRDPRPVFHLHREWSDGGHSATMTELLSPPLRFRVDHQTFTLCGRVADRWWWLEDRDDAGNRKRVVDHGETYAHRLQLRHAEKIGRLCQRCEART